MNDSSSEFDSAEPELQDNIAAAESALNWTLRRGYPGECSLSSIFFTHPDLDIDYLTEFINSLSGHDGISPSGLYGAALRVSHLTSPNQNVEHETYSREELTDEQFRYICRYGLDALWIGTAKPGIGHMMAAIPVDKQRSNFCLWDIGSKIRPGTLSADDIVARVLKRHTAAYEPIHLVRFSTL